MLNVHTHQLQHYNKLSFDKYMIYDYYQFLSLEGTHKILLHSPISPQATLNSDESH